MRGCETSQVSRVLLAPECGPRLDPGIQRAGLSPAAVSKLPSRKMNFVDHSTSNVAIANSRRVTGVLSVSGTSKSPKN